MRHSIVSLMVLSAAVVGAQAQPGHGPGGGHPAAPPAAAAPHPAPAPHTAAPAPPPAAAPHVAAPHVAAPISHAPPPHVAAPAHPAAPHITTPRAAQRAAPSQRLSAQPSNVQRPQSRRMLASPGPAVRARPGPAPQVTQGPTENRNTAAPPGLPGPNTQARPETSPAQQQLGAHLPPSRTPAPSGISPEPRNPSQVPAQVTSRVSPQAAAQGRFAAPFVSRTLQQRAVALPAQDAWRQRRRAAFVAWAGPVFWPYVYTDMFYYAFWPTAYDDGYWAYAYDNVVDGSFWAYGDPYSAFAYAGPNPDTAGLTGGTTRARPRASGGETTGRQLVAACAQDANVAVLPFEQIQAAIDLDPDQQTLFRNMKEAAARAAAAIKSSCPNAFPLTPPGRLQSMTARLEGTVSAIDTIRPALVAFYNSLNDEQKARFNAIGPNLDSSQGARTAASPTNNSCGGAKPGLIDLPIDQIEATVRPTNAQQRSLDQLRDASKAAVDTLASACPDVVPGTPVARLDAMRDRFAAMLQAAKTLQPALSNFYASLNNEQKAAFNTLGQKNRGRG